MRLVEPDLSRLDQTSTSRSSVISLGDTTAAREQNLRVAKPWKCRLRLHDWDDRENPETHEYYQVCLRCNAYRERGRAYPGAGAAVVTGSGGG